MQRGILLLLLIYLLLFLGLALAFRILVFILGLFKLDGSFTYYSYLRKFFWRLAFILSTAVILLGAYNASFPQVVSYTVNIEKNAPTLLSGSTELRIAAISDIHWDTLVDTLVVQRAVQRIKQIAPDIIFILGDSVTDIVAPYLASGAIELLASCEAPLGIYAILGNHDYYEERMSDLAAAYEAAGITVLRDAVVCPLPGLRIIGREDAGGMRRSPEKPRRSLASLLTLHDPADTVIVLDHQPREYATSAALGVDLTLSGHTHAGQIWPVSLLTARMNALNHGMIRIEKSSFIVGAGIGYWGPPLRLGTRCEITEVILKYSQ